MRMNWISLRKRVALIVLFTIVSTLALVGAGIIYQQSASARDLETYPYIGTLIQVDGHEMHLYCMGAGSPTVILEAGVGGNTLLWGYIQPAIAEATRVCAYDRAGYGWSDVRSEARTTPQLAAELHALLMLADIPSPFILVGHSYGGMIVSTFAAHYPSEVAGLVLLDTTHPNQFSSEHCIPACFPASAVTLVDTFYDMLPLMANTGIVRLLVPRGILPLPFFDIPAWFPNREALIALLSTNAHSSTVLAEWNAFPRGSEVASRRIDVSHLPVRLVTALHTYDERPLPGVDPAETTQTWVNLQRDMLKLSSNSVQTIVEDATHFSLLVSPDHAARVVEVIQTLIAEVR
jgi:pimeloyl-ACP methyl ester carboxylesterase